jgi:hypothetical protein
MQYVHIPYNYNTTSKDVKQYRKFFDNHTKKNFIKWCAYKGLLNEHFTPEEINLAKKGTLPKQYNIHHILPISGAGHNNQTVNDFSNLCIISKKLHIYINTNYFIPQIQKGVPTLKIPYLPQIAVSDELYNTIKSNTEIIQIKKERSYL